MNLRLHDKVSHRGNDYQVEGLLDYQLDSCSLRLACLRGPGAALFLEPPTSEMADRVLLFSEIANLDIATPPPAIIDHRGESYLLKVSGTAQIAIAGQARDRQPTTCALWRYRAAGDQFLQIEQWPDRVRTLAGASVHRSMVDIRPATSKDSKDSKDS